MKNPRDNWEEIESVSFTTVAVETVSEIYKFEGCEVRERGHAVTLTNPSNDKRAQEALTNAALIESNAVVTYKEA